MSILNHLKQFEGRAWSEAKDEIHALTNGAVKVIHHIEDGVKALAAEKLDADPDGDVMVAVTGAGIIAGISK